VRFPEVIPAERLAAHSSDNMLLFTAVLAVFIGIILFLLGRHGKQLWMMVWSIGLIICSVSMGLSILLN
jgi:hypothetical protein